MQKCQLNTTVMKFPYIVKSLGGQLGSSQKVLHTPLDLGGTIHYPHLVVLEGRGIDVILGMDWMRFHKVVLHIATQIVELNSSTHGSAIIYVSYLKISSSMVYQVMGKNVSEIPVVCEFFDVFPDDLPGMPPD